MSPPATAEPRHLKVCGFREPEDLVRLRGTGATLAGLWWGVPRSGRDLSAPRLRRLAHHARQNGVQPCLVTFSSDVEALARLVREGGFRWVQLHAFQTPRTVAALRAAVDPGTTIIKVLHVAGELCLEERFTDTYARAGASLLLLDSVSADGRIGSTGEPVPLPVVTRFAETAPLPFLLAGGIRDVFDPRHAAVRDHPRLCGVDVDSGVRDSAGAVVPESVRRVSAAWAAPRLNAPVASRGGSGRLEVSR